MGVQTVGDPRRACVFAGPCFRDDQPGVEPSSSLYEMTDPLFMNGMAKTMAWGWVVPGIRFTD